MGERETPTRGGREKVYKVRNSGPGN